MKHLFKLACLGAAMAAAPFAQADTLNVVAQGTFGTQLSSGTINGTAAGISTAGDTNPFTLVYGEAIFVGGSNPLVYCSTCLNFVFQFKNTNTTANDPILQTSISSFGSFLTTEAYSVSGTGEVAPTSVSRTGGASSTITYSFSSGVPNTSGNGSLTDQLIIFTNATSFTNGSISFQDGTTSSPVAAYVPAVTAATPEPSSLVLLGSGLVSAAGMMLRRRRVA